MTSIAKKLRLSRFKRRGAAGALIVPIDHGLTMGPLVGIRTLAEIGEWISHPAIGGIIAHKGIIERLGDRGALDGLGVMVHLNGMPNFAPTANTKEMLGDVRAAARLGVDAISVQVNFDGHNDSHNLKLLGHTADAAREEGLPLLAMVYDKIRHADETTRLARQQHLIRLSIELGVDALKLAAPAADRLGTDLPQLLAHHASDTPIYFAGGEARGDDELIALAEQSLALGGAGLCVGRNVFGKERPQPLLETLDRILNKPRAGAPAIRLLEVNGLGVH